MSSTINENTPMNSWGSLENFNQFEFENVDYDYEIKQHFDFPHKLNETSLPEGFKIVKNSKKENSLFLLKAENKNQKNNEKFDFRMMRNSIWKKNEQDYDLVNVNPNPYKITVTPSKGITEIISNLNISENVDYYQQHIDGPLFRVYYHDDQWIISTTSLIYADGHWLNRKSFVDLFNETCKSIGLSLDMLDTSLSYYFIMIHPEYLQVVSYSDHAIYFKEARNNEFKVVDHEKVQLPECIKRLEIYHDMVVLNTQKFSKSSDLFTIVLNNGDNIRVSNWIYEELNNMKGNRHHVRDMIINVLRQPHHRVQLFVDNFPVYTNTLNEINSAISLYSCLLFRKYLKKETWELSYEYPLQKNLFYHVKQMYAIKNDARKNKQHILDIVIKSDFKQGRYDYEWKENYVHSYVMSLSDENISIILGMMKKLEKDFQDLLQNGTLSVNEENLKFWEGN